MFTGMRVGFYGGDVLKLTEDARVLQPTFFPSVPRLFNKIYGKIKEKFSSATGVKDWLMKRALNAKML